MVSVLLALAAAAQTWALTPDPIGADRPWYIFRAPRPAGADALAYADGTVAAWNELSAPLRALSAIEVPGPRTGTPGWGDRFHDVLNELQVREIPCVVAVTDSPRTLYPAEELRALFERYTQVRGVAVSGLHFSEYPALSSFEPMAVPAQARWLASAIEVAAQYGRRVIIELDGLEWLHLTANAWNESLLEAMRRHPAVVVPMNSQRGLHSVVATSAVMGLWLDGAAAQWGLACDSAWYAASGFIEPGQFGRAATVMPAPLYRAMVLNGAMTGATVYRFSEPDDLWYGTRRAYWDEAIRPVLTEIADRGFIARQDFVLGKAKVAFRLNPASSLAEFDANLADLDPIFHQGYMLHGAYGVELPGQVPELILNTGLFYWIPVLPPFASEGTLGQFHEVMMPGALRDAREWRERLLTLYAPDGEGTAFISKIGRAYFVMHTRENFYEDQPFALAAVPAPVRGATASRLPDGIEISWGFRESDVFYRVYRRELPGGSWEQISGDIDGHAFRDTRVPGPDVTIAYAVTALTNETEPYEGSVNYGDYLVVNAIESRMVEQVVFEPDTQAASGLPLPPEVDGRPAAQQWWPDFGELEGEQLHMAQSIVAQIESFELAYHERNFNSMMALYHPDYWDDAGWTIEYVRAAWDLLFKRYRTGPIIRAIRGWDLSELGSTGRITLRIYCRLLAQPVEPAGADSPAPALEFPPASYGVVSFTFARRDDQWLIVHTEPALPRIDDWFPAIAP